MTLIKLCSANLIWHLFNQPNSNPAYETMKHGLGTENCLPDSKMYEIWIKVLFAETIIHPLKKFSCVKNCLKNFVVLGCNFLMARFVTELLACTAESSH